MLLLFLGGIVSVLEDVVDLKDLKTDSMVPMSLELWNLISLVVMRH